VKTTSPGLRSSEAAEEDYSDQRSSSTTACVWWKISSPYARSNIPEQHTRERERREAKAKGMNEGEGLPPLYIGQGEGEVPPGEGATWGASLGLAAAPQAACHPMGWAGPT